MTGRGQTTMGQKTGSRREHGDGRRRWALALLFAAASGCGDSVTLTREQLMDPTSCQSCHPRHFQEWAGSMHAYAAEDPVFVAMNARGQRETGGALGDFCVRCHAPMAVRTGQTRDGLNLATLPAALRGVTCYFCHQVTAVQDTHNNPLLLADDQTMRGGIQSPRGSGGHLSAYSPLHDRQKKESATLCGSCHDVVTPAGVQLERTLIEWQGSLFATGEARQQLTCGQCHMAGTQGPAADVAGAPSRLVHDHMAAAVDVALTDFPAIDAQRTAVQRELDSALQAKLCVSPDGGATVLDVTLDNVGGGHDFPSGASHDRRAWVELTAYAGATRVFQSGAVADGQAAVDLADPNLWLMRDRVFDAGGKDAHMFWDVARYQTEHLPPALTADPLDPRYFHAVTRSYRVPMRGIDRVTVRVRMRPIDHDVLSDLVRSGDLPDPIRTQISTFTLAGTQLEWRSGGASCVP